MCFDVKMEEMGTAYGRERTTQISLSYLKSVWLDLVFTSNKMDFVLFDMDCIGETKWQFDKNPIFCSYITVLGGQMLWNLLKPAEK